MSSLRRTMDTIESRRSIYRSLNVKSYFTAQLTSNGKVKNAYFVVGWLLAIFCLVFQHVYIIMILMSLIRNRGNIWDMLSRLMTCLTSAITFDLWIYKRRIILKFNKKVERHLKNLINEYEIDAELPESRSCVVGGALYIVLSLAVVILAMVLSSPDHDTDIWVENLCVFCNASALTKSVYTQLAITDIVMYTLGTVGSGVIIQVMFIFVCLTVVAFTGIAHRNLKKRFQSKFMRSCDFGDLIQTPLTRGEVLKYRRLCKSGKSLIKHINYVYSTVFLLWYGSSLLCTCHAITTMLGKYKTLRALDYGVYLVIHGQSLIGVIVVSIVSSGIPQKLSQNAKYFQGLTMSYQNISPDVFGELNILMTQINYPPVGIMVGECFLITKGFFLSYLGVIITYTVLLIQLNPKLLETLQISE